MRYLVSSAFIKIAETSGTIQNAHQSNTVEVSNTPVKDSGLLLAPRDKFTFSDTQLYVRCTGLTGAEVRVVPFYVNVAVVQGSVIPIDDDSEASDDDFAADSEAAEAADDGWNGNATSDPTVDDMWQAVEPDDTGDGWTDTINDIFNP